MNVPPHIIADAVQRAQETREARRSVLQRVLARRPLDVEPDEDRRLRRIERRVGVGRDLAAAIASGEAPEALGLNPEQVITAKSVQGTVDFLPMSFLARGRKVANAVGRLVGPSGSAVGTCFMISNRLLITNNHVIGSAQTAGVLQVEFEFEMDADGTRTEVASFALNPTGFFVTDGTTVMDYTVVALGSQVNGTPAADRLTFCRLSGRNDKHALGEYVNIIQHPGGGRKQVVLRENHLVTRPETEAGVHPVLQYMADTLESSSGSPVFNDDWDVMALHHASVIAGVISVCGQTRPDVVNEGTRASYIVDALRAAQPSLSAEQQALLDDALRE